MVQVEPTKKGRQASVRCLAVEILTSLYKNNGSISSLLPAAQNSLDSNSAALLQEMVFGVSRWFYQLEAELQPLLKKSLRNKDLDVKMLLLLGIYQLQHMRIAPHAALNETVGVSKEIRKDWSRGLVNAVLRNYLQTREEGQTVAVEGLKAIPTLVAQYSHPQWIIETLQSDWPERWRAVLDASNARPPLILRINRQRIGIDDYRQMLEDDGIASAPIASVDGALRLEQPVPVSRLPGFFDGLASVQDGSAQLAVELLSKKILENQSDGDRGSGDSGSSVFVLDACAAPGGKTCHLLEALPEAHVVALDVSESRLHRVDENLQRLNLSKRATVVVGDAADRTQWWDGTLFDAILLDVPCSGTGVTRRQPDIRMMRRESDLGYLLESQRNIIDSCWPALKPGGYLLYVTCSLLKQENELQMQQFSMCTPSAKEVDLLTVHGELPGQRCESAGWQILTGDDGLDGFYFCLLEKCA